MRGVRVLVGRARHQASALSSELRRLGASVIEIPFIEIRKPRSFRPLDAALQNLGSYDWLILTSANGVKAMWSRMVKLRPTRGDRSRAGSSFAFATSKDHEGHGFSRAARNADKNAALAAEGERRKPLHIAAIGPATQKAIEQRGVKVDVVPEEYVAESVVQSLRSKVKGKRVLLVRAKVARDVIPRELRRAGARVDVVEAYETVVPLNSRRRLRAALKNPKNRPHVVTFTSSSTVRNFVELLGGSQKNDERAWRSRGRTPALTTPKGRPRRTSLDGIRMASIGPVTSSTLRELGLPVDIEASEFTIPGLVAAIGQAFAGPR